VRQAPPAQGVNRVGRSAAGVARQRPIDRCRRKASLLVMRLVDRAVALDLEALAVKPHDLLGLLVFEPAYDRRDVDRLAGKVLQHGPPPKQEFFERRL